MIKNLQFLLTAFVFCVLILFPFLSSAQTFIANEDFSSGSGDTPPADWLNVTEQGTTSDLWRFDNPGNRDLAFPFVGSFAIFDADSISNDGSTEQAVLESPFLDCSTSDDILILFDHKFLSAGGSATASLEVFDGSQWQVAKTYTADVDSVREELINVSALIGGITNAKIRFKWNGNGSGFWALDNVQVYGALNLDAALTSIDNPVMPFNEGTKNIEVSLLNFGASNLTSATINWSVNGVAQTPYNWTGNLAIGEDENNIVVGSYNFVSGVVNNISIEVSDPNGGVDQSSLNNTKEEALTASLCGVYTIGGVDGDFANFTEAAKVLRTGGITCPVTFQVRNGVYDEQILLENIPGNSLENSISFKGESGDSTSVLLRYNVDNQINDYTLKLANIKGVFFEDLSFDRGANRTLISISSSDSIIFKNSRIGSRRTILEGNNEVIHFNNNVFQDIIELGGSDQSSIQLQNNKSIRSILMNVRGIVENIDFTNNSIRDRISITTDYFNELDTIKNVKILNNTVSGSLNISVFIPHDSISILNNRIINNALTLASLNMSSYEGHSSFKGNKLNNLGGRRILIAQGVDEIEGNRFSGAEEGVAVTIGGVETLFVNNYITVGGIGSSSALSITEGSSGSRILYNSINNTGTNATGSLGLQIQGAPTNLLVKNNIIAATGGGIPFQSGSELTPADWDYNNYYSPSGVVANYAGTTYNDVASLGAALGSDANSLEVNPFFTSSTDLSIHQGQLEGAGVSDSMIVSDINGIARNSTPEIGATNYELCDNDAGINEILSPGSPLDGTNQEIIVELQNHGSNALTTVQINWELNGQVQTPIDWTGSLASKEADTISLGDQVFSGSNIFDLRVWTNLPNGVVDCDTLNDSSIKEDLVASLCGVYTIGGVDGDFANFTEAAKVLRTGGITCPVTFQVRNGVYDEQILLENIPGNSLENSISFKGESGDSTSVLLRYNVDNQINDYTLKLANIKGVFFEDLSFDRGANRTLISISSSDSIIFKNSRIGSRRTILEGNNEVIHFNNNVFQDIIELGGSDQSSIQLQNNKSIRSILMNVRGIVENIDFTNNSIRDRISITTDYFNELDTIKNVKILNNTVSGSLNISVFIPHDSISILNNRIINNALTLASLNMSSYEGHSSFKGNKLNNLGGRRILIAQGVDEIEGNRFSGAEEGVAVTIGGVETLFVNNYITVGGIGSSSALSITEGSSGSRILYNSINSTGTNATGSLGLQIQGAPTNLLVKNNIIAATGGGIPFQSGSELTPADWDYNNYYSPSGVVANYAGTTYNDVASLGAALGSDANSLEVNPFFTSSTDLSIHQGQLEGAGVSDSMIVSDINGIARNSTPEIGATNYELCDNDAGINEILSPGSPLDGTNQEIIVELQNHGSNALTTVQINWELNGQVQTPIDWTGSLASKEADTISLGDQVFSGSNIFDLRVWTNLPNGVVDCDTLNDSSIKEDLVASLCGVYTIGGVDGDFANFTEAAKVLRTGGITCPVTFQVRNGVYDEQILLENIPGNSLENSISFKGESGDSTSVLLRYNVDNQINDYTLKLANIKGVFFEGLSFDRGANRTLISISSSDSIIFKNSRIGSRRTILEGNNEVIHFNNNVFQDIIELGGSDQSSIQLQNNKSIRSILMNVRGIVENIDFTNNSIRDRISITTDYFNELDTIKNVKILNNTVSGSLNISVFIPHDSISILNNRIINNALTLASLNMSSYEGHSSFKGNKLNNLGGRRILIAQGVDEIEGNRFSGAEEGVAVTIGGVETLFVNNYITVGGIGSSSALSITEGSSGSRILYNSINNTGTNATGSLGLQIQGAPTNLLVKNNIIAATGGGIPFQSGSELTPADWDYNNYYSPSGVVANYAGTTYTNVAGLGAALGSDANSLEISPFFLSTTDLIPLQKQLNGAGINAGGIALDIDGELRNLLAPDIGAQEFTVDFGVTQLVSPNLDCNQTDSAAIEIVVRQFGDIPFIDQEVAYQMNGGPVKSEVIPGTFFNDIDYTFTTTEDLSQDGSYEFKIWLVDNNDENVNNDTLVVTRYKNDRPVVDFTNTSSCAGEDIVFAGEASIATGSIVSYEWDFGDGSISTQLSPAHRYDSSGVYEVEFRAYSDQGCFGSVVKNIEVQTTPISSFTYGNLCKGDTISFVNTTTVSQGEVTYLWEISDGTTYTTQDIDHAFDASGVYTVSLTTTSTATSCSDVYTEDIVVNDLPVISLEIFDVDPSNLESGKIVANINTTASSYETLWSNGIINQDSIFNLEAGTYSITVTDALGCTATAQAIVETGLRTSSEITAFSFPNALQTSIDEVNVSLTITMPAGTDLTTLVADFTLSDSAIATINGVEQVSGVTVNDYSSPLTYVVTAEDTTVQTEWTVNVIVDGSSNTEILNFSIPNQTSSTIDSVSNAITVNLPFGSDLTALAPSFNLSAGATASVNDSIQQSDITENDFTNPVVYAVLAEDSVTVQNWTIEVVLDPNSKSEILAYSIPAQDSAAVDSVKQLIEVYMPYGSDLISLAADFTLSDSASATVSGIEQISGTTSNDFTNPLDYVVTAEDGVNQSTWVVDVKYSPNTATEIISYSIPNQDSARFDSNNQRIKVYMPYGTNLNSLVAEFMLSDSATAVVNGIEQVSGTTANDFGYAGSYDFGPVVDYTIIAEDGVSQSTWNVQVFANPNTDSEILSYSIPGQDSSRVDSINQTVDVFMPYGTDPSSLVAGFTLSDSAFATVNGDFNFQRSGSTVNDFSSPVVYKVTSEDRQSESLWTVQVNIPLNTESEFLDFSIASQDSAIVDSVNQEITVYMPYAANLTNLVANFTLSNGAVAFVKGTKQISGQTANDFTSPVDYVVIAENGISQSTWTAQVVISPNTQSEILAFNFPESISTEILTENKLIKVEVPFGTDLKALTAEFTLSDRASAFVNGVEQISGSTSNNFSNLVTYEVIAEDGSSKDFWFVAVNIAPNTESDITAFNILNQVESNIDSVNHEVVVNMPYGTDITSLIPEFSLSPEASVTVNGTGQVSGVTTNDFTNPVTYSVTAGDGITEQSWTVEVVIDPNTATNITAFDLPMATSLAVIDEVNHSVAITVPFGTDVSSLSPTFSLSAQANATVNGVNQISGVTTNDFTTPVTYSVTAGDGTTQQDWTVEVVIDPNTATDITAFDLPMATSAAVIDATAHTIEITVPFGTDVSGLAPTFSLSAQATASVNGAAQASGVSVNDFINPVTYQVTAGHGTTQQNWVVEVVIDSNTATDITAFDLPMATSAAVIDEVNHTVEITVPFGTDVNSLAPTFSISEQASAIVNGAVQTSGVSSNNFTNPVTYSVTAGDGTTEQDWILEVVIDPNTATDIPAFDLPMATSTAVIDEVNHSIEITVPLGTQVSSLAPTFSLSAQANATVNGAVQTSGVTTNDFTNTVTYQVTAGDGTTQQDWTVEVVIDPNTATDITAFDLPMATSAAVLDEVNHSIEITVPFGTQVSSLTPIFSVSAQSTVSVNGAIQSSGVSSNDFTNPVTYSVTAGDGTTQQDWTVEVVIDPNTATDITAFDLPMATSAAVIDETAHSVEITVPFGTDVSILAPIFNLSAQARATVSGVVQTSGVTINDFTNPVTYSVTAGDGTTQQSWTVEVVIDPNTATDITAFDLPMATSSAVIDEVNHRVAITVPFGTDVNSLSPTFSLSAQANATVNGVNQVSGVTINDFTNPVTYSVTAGDGTSQQSWTVEVVIDQNTATDITAFDLPMATSAAVIDEVNHRVEITVPFGTDVSSLSPTFGLSAQATASVNGATQSSGVSTNDFTNPVTYTVTAGDGTTQQDWTVEVVINLNTATDVTAFDLPMATSTAVIDAAAHSVEITVPFGTDVNSLAPTFSLSEQATATVNSVAQTSGVTTNDFTNTVTYSVVAGDGTSQQDWTVEVVIDPNTATDITAFDLPMATTAAVIDEVNHSVEISVPFGTDPSSIVPTFNLSAQATATVNGSVQTSGVSVNDFTNPVTYIVTAGDGTSQQDWTVEVVIDPNTATDITAFDLPMATSAAVIDEVNHSVEISVPFGTDVSSLSPTFGLSAQATASVNGAVQTSGVSVNDFTNPVTYRVTAGDGTTEQDWNVEVVIDPNTATDITTFDLPMATTVAVLDEVNHSVEITVPFGTEVNNLAPTFSLSAQATASVNGAVQTSGVTTNDFTNTVTYSVAAGDGTTEQDWNVEVVIDPNTATDITTFDLPMATSAAVIDEANHSVEITVPFGTDVSSLSPTFSLSAQATASVNGATQSSGVSTNDFTNPVAYSVTAGDGTTQQSWTVEVVIDPNTATDITAFDLPMATTAAVIDEVNHSIEITVPFGTDVSSLAPTFSLSAQATASINGVTQSSGVSTNDFTNPVTYTVTAGDGTTQQDWTVEVVINLNTATDITAFDLPMATSTAVIDAAAHSVEITVLFGTDVNSLAPTFSLSEQATATVNGAVQTSGVTTNDFTNPRTYTVTAGDGTTQQNWTVEVVIDPNTATDITAFGLPMATSAAVINEVNHSIDISVPFGTEVSSLAPTYNLSAQATATVNSVAQTSGVSVNDFTNPVIYSVTAGDGMTQQEWTAEVVIDQNTATDITAFDLPMATSAAVIDELSHSVEITVPFGTDVSSLAPTFSLSAQATTTVNGVNQVSGVSANDFTNLVNYSVNAGDGVTQQDWTVEVVINPNTATDITAFDLPMATTAAVIDEVNHSVEISVPFGTDPSSIVPTFNLSAQATATVNGSVQTSGVSVNDFTNPVTYSVTAGDGTQQDWTVEVVIDPNTATDITAFDLPMATSAAVIDATAHTIEITVPFGTEVNSLAPTFSLSAQATATVNGTVQASGVTANDFTSPVTYKVTAGNGTQQDWTVEVFIDPNTATDFTAFDLPMATSAAVIDEVNHSVEITVPFGTDVSSLSPTFGLSAQATASVNGAVQTSGVSVNDFTNPVTYRVTAGDGTTEQDWTVEVVIDPNTATDILSFELTAAIEPSQIDTAEHTVHIVVPYGTDLTNLVPQIEVSEGASVVPNSGTSQNFTDPVRYFVIAENANFTQEWMVSVDIAPRSETDILSFSLAEQTSPASIDFDNHIVEIEVSNETNVNELSPEIEISGGASIDPGSEELVNFSSAVIYTVTAEDSITAQDWVVIVSVSNIVKEDQEIDFEIPSTLYFDQSPFALEAVASSGLPVEFIIENGEATIWNNNLIFVEESNLVIKAVQKGNDTLKAVEVSREVQIIGNFDLSVLVKRPDDSPLEEGLAKLFKKDGGLYENQRFVNGDLKFEDVRRGEYILQIIPLGSSTSDIFPTYYSNTKFNREATDIILSGDTSIEMTMLAKSKQSDDKKGEGRITGRVVKSNNPEEGRVSFGEIAEGTGVEELAIYLIEESTGEIFNSTVTDISGNFDLEEIPSGDYIMLLDIPGVEQSASSFSFSYKENKGDLKISIFITDEGGLDFEVETILGVEDPKINVNVYPNPTDGILFLTGFNGSGQSVSIFTPAGAIVKTVPLSKSDRHKIDIRELNSGVYYMKLGSDDVKLIKIIKK